MRVRAAVLTEPGSPFQIRELELAPPGPREVRVRLEASGVCASEWHLVSGATQHPFPVVPGHEGAGIVEEVGAAVSRVAPGDRVCLSWAPECGHCFQCASARPGLCETHGGPIWAGHLLDGTTRFFEAGRPVHHFSGLACFAERTVVPENACVRAQEGVPPAVAAIVGCAVTTGMGAAINTGGTRPGERVLVYGAGGIGLSAVIGASLAGASRVLVADRTSERAEQARAFGGTDPLVDGPEVVEQVRELCGGVDVAIETTGRPEQQERCLRALRPGGRLVLVGLGSSDEFMRVCGADLIRQGKQVRGSYYGDANPPLDFPRIQELYRAGRLPLDGLISRNYTLDQINEAYADLNAGKLLRGILTF